MEGYGASDPPRTIRTPHSVPADVSACAQPEDVGDLSSDEVGLLPQNHVETRANSGHRRGVGREAGVAVKASLAGVVHPALVTFRVVANASVTEPSQGT